MRAITDKERKMAGNIYCDHCKPEKVDAKWRKRGITASHQGGDFACEAHKHLIKEDSDDGHMTEADYQTWGRV
jgi:hypothetical protein